MKNTELVAQTFAQVLVISDSCISSAHGTGTLLLRHFSRYPSNKLANAYYREQGVPAWPASLRFEVRHGGRSFLGLALNFAARLYNSAVLRLGLKRWSYHRPFVILPHPREIFGDESNPEVIYSVVHSEAGLALTSELCKCMPSTVPLLQYFLDYQIAPGLGRERYLRKVLARADEIWALTEKIAEAVSPIAASYGKSIRVQPGFHMELPSRWKENHRETGQGGFRCLISGNFWQSQMAGVVKRVWRKVQDASPGLAPIEWYCHAESVKRTLEAVGSLEPEIHAVGFFAGEDLLERLTDADLAIVPFNVHRKPESDYARYSLPSRLTELLALGVPVFCIAGDETPLAAYVTRHDVGVVCDAEDECRLVQRLVAFVHDRDARMQTGLRARRFAEVEFALEPFQRFLYSQLGSRWKATEAVIAQV